MARALIRRVRPAPGEHGALTALAGVALAVGALAGRQSRRVEALRAETARARSAAARAELQAEEARSRVWMLEQVGDTVRGLLTSSRPREAVCRAAVDIAGAHAAIIYEPRTAGALACTAMSGLDFGDGEVSVGSTSRAQQALDIARPVFLAQAREDRVASVELWRAAGRPASILYQPIVRYGSSLGVLAVGWREVVPFDGAECATVELLAHEAAAILAHADAVDTLTGHTRTDALTGLPNRRGFDAALAAALERGVGVAVAKFDLDGFTRFNDTFGYPAGDRHLRTYAAIGRSALRGEDVLARVDGEEFALLLVDCDEGRAVEIAERLRRAAPDGGTCSAGVAVARSGEPAEALRARADAALGEAKAAGRDRLRLS